MEPRIAACVFALLASAAGVVVGKVAAQDGVVQVQTIPLRQQLLSDTVSGFGTVAASEEATANISFPHAGQIIELDVRAGEKVRAGQQLAIVTSDPATQLNYRNATAALEFAQKDLERTKTLLAQHLATNAQVAAAQKALEDARAAVATERRLGNDQPTRAATAPFDGVVSQIMVAPGDRAAANTALMKLVRTDRGTTIMVGLTPENANRVKPGMMAQVSPVLGDAASPLVGSVQQISGTLSAATKLVDAWVDVTSTSPALVPGAAASVTIVLASHSGWVVPRAAVLRNGNTSYVFQVAGTRAKQVMVTTGIETDEWTEVGGPLDPSLEVVTLGNYELHDGMAIREALRSQQP
jgi:RND family efflux transporter MFP subunit